MTRIQILNILAENFNLKSYLEIGVQEPKNCLLKINCLTKVGVDPAVSHPLVYKTTSDNFFSTNTKKFDLIFIDGLHEYNQVKKDFLNALEVLNDNGFIMLHDTMPLQKETTEVPRKTKIWHGDVYRLVLELFKYCKYVTIDTDNGCTVCWKGNSRDRVEVPLNWDSFIQHQDYMHIRRPHEVDFRNIRKY